MQSNSLPPVLLASASPRRRELLTLIGIPHAVRPADVDETVLLGERPAPHAERLARLKAETVAHSAPEAREALVVAADTIVVIDDTILGKPATQAEARRMLTQLSGRTHTVVTAIACAHNGRTVAGVEQVDVTFRPLGDDEISAYIATGEPMDKAGSYGIQGYGATIVQRIDGDYFAVMGLSLVRLVALMQQLGFTYRFGQ